MVTFFTFDDFDYSQSIPINRILLILIFFTYCTYADRVRKQKLQQIYTRNVVAFLRYFNCISKTYFKKYLLQFASSAATTHLTDFQSLTYLAVRIALKKRR